MFTKKSSSNDIRDKNLQDSQKKSVELDIEKKVIVLEDSLDKLKESIRATGEIKDLKESLARLAQIQGKLREMEDLDLITKLETIQAQDEILVLTDDMETLQGKMELLSGAIKMISTKITVPDAKRDTANFEGMISSLRLELDSVKKRMESHDTKNNTSKMGDFERKYRSIDTEFKKFVSAIKIDLEKRDKEFKSMLSTQPGTTDKAEIDAVNAEIATMKDVIDKVENLVNASRKGAKEFESRITENNEKIHAQLNEQAKALDSFRDVDKKLTAVLDSKISSTKQDITRSTHDANKEQIAQLPNDIAVCRKNTPNLEEKTKLLNEIKAEVEPITENNNDYRKRIDTIDHKINLLDKFKNKELEDRFCNIDNKIAGIKSVYKKFSEKLDSQKPNGTNHMKYVPVLKENVSKLYKVYNRAEKRIADIESHIADNKDNVKDSTVRKAVAAELSDVVKNINTLSADIKSEIKDETLKQKVLMNALRNEFNVKLLSLETDSADMSKRMKKSKSESHNYEEFAEFKAKVLSDINELKNNMKKSEKKVSSSEVENIFDDKFMPHASNQDKIAKSVALLNRKLEQRHVEVSKSAHEKIKTSVKPLAERVSQIESDIVLLKDTKTELIDDVRTIIENFGKKEEKSGANINNIEKNYDEKFRELAKKIEMIQSGNGMTGEMLERKMRAVQNESEVLRQELEKIKGLYFEMLDRDKNAPVIIE